jgi:hypothetical protein
MHIYRVEALFINIIDKNQQNLPNSPYMNSLITAYLIPNIQLNMNT